MPLSRVTILSNGRPLTALIIFVFVVGSSFEVRGEAPVSCRAFHSILLEGTGEGSDQAEHWFHKQTSQWARAVSANATSINIVPPSEKVTKIRGTDPDVTDNLRMKINSSTDVCRLAPALADYMAGRGGYTTIHRIAPDEFLKYGEGEFAHDGYHPTVFQSENPEGQLKVGSFFNPTLQSITKSKLPAIASILKAKAECSAGKFDQVAYVTISDHGMNYNGQCVVQLSTGQQVTPADVYGNILMPLEKMGVKVIFNVNACYSGCFIQKLKSFGRSGNVCLMSETRSSTIGYGADDLFGNTFDVTYPHFLRYLGDPLKAFICAAALDPFNEPQIASFTREQPKVADDKFADLPKEQKLDEAFDLITQKLGDSRYKNLRKECEIAHSKPDFPVPPLAANPEKMKALLSCKGLASLNELFPGSHELSMKEYYAKVNNPKSWPGLDALLRLGRSDNLQNSVRACGIDLTAYRPILETQLARRRSQTGGEKIAR